MTRLYQIHNLVIFLKNILWSQGRRQSSPPSPAALNFGMKWGSAVAHFILCWHAICFLHTSLKSHKNNYKIISTAFLKKQLTKTHMVAKLNTGQCPACWELLTHKHGGNQRQRQKARHEVQRQRLHRLGDCGGEGPCTGLFRGFQHTMKGLVYCPGREEHSQGNTLTVPGKQYGKGTAEQRQYTRWNMEPLPLKAPLGGNIA